MDSPGVGSHIARERPDNGVSGRAATALLAALIGAVGFVGSAFLHTLIQLGKALGLQTLAEGVEHDSQVHELQREGCDLAQGFLFARPLTPDAVEHFLADHRLEASRAS
jgi:nucleoside-diphosphate-sugar epimerase